MKAFILYPLRHAMIVISLAHFNNEDFFYWTVNVAQLEHRQDEHGWCGGVVVMALSVLYIAVLFGVVGPSCDACGFGSAGDVDPVDGTGFRLYGCMTIYY